MMYACANKLEFFLLFSRLVLCFTRQSGAYQRGLLKVLPSKKGSWTYLHVLN
jgi:hypothetical protein